MNQPTRSARDAEARSYRVPFRMHPRVFAALGADLVTNDVVAIIELIKNSYDAYARKVHLRFSVGSQEGSYLEILDDGYGMTRDVIENAWCLVATPYKEKNPIAMRDKRERRVAGEKGLGRLSVARLGRRMSMVTQAVGDICWNVEVDWSSLSDGDDLSDSYALCSEYEGNSPFEDSGTRIRIFDLAGQWSESKVSDLEENLARLISPFSAKKDFNIYLTRPDASEDEEIEIESPLFLSAPKYRIKGSVDADGNISATYGFSDISGQTYRTISVSRTWKEIVRNKNNREIARLGFVEAAAHCGPFQFEIRAWDIATEDTAEIAERFSFKKSQIRKAIRAHKGISLYRDDVLVLPKSENARDWLGLDLRRVSRVGVRLSTNQIVGYVSISAAENPHIEDTSDRERLVSTREVEEFREIVKSIVDLLENERDQDRAKPHSEKPMQDLFATLDAGELLDEIRQLSDEGAQARETIPPVREFGRSLASSRKRIQERFVYYSRLSTVGTIAHMLVHEIRNRTVAMGGFLQIIRDRFAPFEDSRVESKYRFADQAVDALESLAERFTPLASRNFRRRKRNSVLEDRIRDCLLLRNAEIKHKNVECRVPEGTTNVAVDPGELDAILLNLISNAVYWMSDTPKDSRILEFGVTSAETEGRVQVTVTDTGCGISAEDLERVFWPGVTRKPGGIGMGLTVASELVDAYDGKMAVEYRDEGEGASFVFDLPLFKQRRPTRDRTR